MSQYVQFFIKTNENNFLPIATYSRSSKIFQYFREYVPFEKIGNINDKTVQYIMNDITTDYKSYKETIEKNKKTIERVSSFKDSDISEKIEIIERYEEYIEEMQEEIEELNYTKYFIYFLNEMIEEAKYDHNVKNKDYIYAGIEVGYPTLEDVV